jgi:parallel beta-helix repeat protein
VEAQVSSGRAFDFDRPDRGFVRIVGQFTTPADLDLGGAAIRATAITLLERRDGLPAADLAPDLPIELAPRTRSGRVTVFETPPGRNPLVRLVVRMCVAGPELCEPLPGGGRLYDFRLEAVNVTLGSPLPCDPAHPLLMATRFVLDDGVHDAVHVESVHPWICSLLGSRVNRLDAAGAAPATADRLVDDDLVPCLPGPLPIHATVGGAVEAAADGETIVVCPGRYPERVMIQTPNLTLRARGSVRMLGFLVWRGNTPIEGFELSGTDGCGVSVEAGAALIRDNRVHDSGAGICVSSGGGHRIERNVVERNGYGISFAFSGGAVSGNLIRGNQGWGVIASECLGGSVTIQQNLVHGNGISVGDECGAVITGNTVRAAPTRGISVAGARSPTVTHNVIRHGTVGVHLERTSGATVSSNLVGFAGVGIDVLASTGAIVTGNTVARDSLVDCRWDGSGVNVLADNDCGSQSPAGAFD